MKQYIFTTIVYDVLLYIFFVLFLLFVWCSCMAINVSVQYNGGLFPDIILLTQCYYHRVIRLNAMSVQVRRVHGDLPAVMVQRFCTNHVETCVGVITPNS